MRRFLRDNALSLFFFALFVLALFGQSIAGFLRTNEDLSQHGMPEQGYLAFVFSSDFVVDVAENWQSEFLQFLLFIAATVWFVQRGSPSRSSPVTKASAPMRIRRSAPMQPRMRRPARRHRGCVASSTRTHW